MDKNSETLLEKNKAQSGDYGSIGIGSAIAGPVGALLGLGANRLWRWGRGVYSDLKNKRKVHQKWTSKVPPQKQQQGTQQQQQPKSGLDAGEGMFEPEIYKSCEFYKTTIYDERNPKENNFVYISKSKNGAEKAYENFINSWAQKFKDERNLNSFEVEEYKELIRNRFHLDPNVPCLITVPQYYLLDRNDVLSMAKNSDIEEKENNIYYDKNSFDSNYAYDLHMYQYKSEAVSEDDTNECKVSLFITGAYGRNYTYAYDQVPGEDPHKEIENVMVTLGDELINDAEDTLYAFSRVCEQLVDNERIRTDVYTVAAPLLRKNSKKAEDLEYNHDLLDGVGVYNSKDELIEHYLEDYQKLIENQMSL